MGGKYAKTFKIHVQSGDLRPTAFVFGVNPTLVSTLFRMPPSAGAVAPAPGFVLFGLSTTPVDEHKRQDCSKDPKIAGVGRHGDCVTCKKCINKSLARVYIRLAGSAFKLLYFD